MQDKNDRPELTPAEQDERLKAIAITVLCVMCLIGPLLPQPKPTPITANVATQELPEPPAPEPSTYEPTPVASSLPDRDTVAADILAVACGNQVGLVAYDAIGGQLKTLLEGDGINPQEVHSNWDYYYSRAKEMDSIKGYGCVQ